MESRATAPALSRGSFPLPHLGDCTQAGQPRSQPHAAMAARVADSHLEGVVGPLGEPRAPGCPS